MIDELIKESVEDAVKMLGGNLSPEEILAVNSTAATIARHLSIKLFEASRYSVSEVMGGAK